MKKSILIFSAFTITCSLMAFGIIKLENKESKCQTTVTCKGPTEFASAFPMVINKPEPIDLHFGISNRFNTTITKEKLNKATSILDIIPSCATDSRMAYQNSRIYVLHQDQEIMELGNSEILNPSQKELLRSVDYSTNIRVTSICKRKNNGIISLHNDSLVYYITVIPENEATYTNGQEALISYLKENSKEQTASMNRDQLKPGKINFTITKEGKVANVFLDSTCGYSTVDKTLVNLVRNMPGKWNPATNLQGEKFEQELVFSFGMIGC